MAAADDVPRVLTDVPRLLDADDRAQRGAVWSIDEPERELDANVIHLPAGDEIAPHAGGDLDVLVHVLRGAGTLATAADDVLLTAGMIAFLPRRSVRGFRAGLDGLTYLTVHRRRTDVGLWPAMPGATRAAIVPQPDDAAGSTHEP